MSALAIKFKLLIFPIKTSAGGNERVLASGFLQHFTFGNAAVY